MRDWVTNVGNTHYLIGSVMGPHPYPVMVRDFVSVIGKEARSQMLEREGRLPHYCVACVGGGSNAIGLFHEFIPDESVHLIGVEAAGHGIESGQHAATLSAGTPGVLHGSYSYLLQDESGQVQEAHSISAGLDYPGVGPEHATSRPASARSTSRHGHRSAGGVPDAVHQRGHHPGAGVVARGGLRDEAGAAIEAGRHRAGQPLGARRQGPADGGAGAGAGRRAVGKIGTCRMNP